MWNCNAVAPRIRVQVRSFDAMCRVVASGLGLAILPRAAAALYATALQLVKVELDGVAAERVLLLATRRRSEHRRPARRPARHHVIVGGAAADYASALLGPRLIAQPGPGTPARAMRELIAPSSDEERAFAMYRLGQRPTNFWMI
jgi:hypothetical protein